MAPNVHAAPAHDGVRQVKHLFVLVLENENFDDSWGAKSPAHFLDSLVPQGTFADHYFATGHASLDNYIAMVSGQPANPLTAGDCAAVNLWQCVQPQSLTSGGRNLADQLDEKKVSWKGYMDTMPGPCFHADYSPTAPPGDPYQGNSQAKPAYDYADRHDPFLYFDDIVGNDARCKQHVVPFTSLAKDIALDRVPSFGFITPDTCHDGHDDPCSNGKPGGLVSADRWLTKTVPPLLDYLRAHDGVLLITFDENGFSDANDLGCCTGGPGGVQGFGGRIGLLALGSGIQQGKVVHTSFDHMSLLRTVEDAFGIDEHLNNASTAVAMKELFR